MKKSIVICLMIICFNVSAQEIVNVEDTTSSSGLFELNLEELLNMEVTSVSKKAERLQDVMSSIYVITNADIIKSGATTLHEVLRTLPGYWGVQLEYSEVNDLVRMSAPESGSRASVLYLLDGTPIQNLMQSSFSFKNFDIPLEEIDRIEFIRGSGGSIYGANSATGVVNIFTKNPEKYDGVNVRAEVASPFYTNVTLRGGTKINEQVSLSAYAKVRRFEGYGRLREFDGEEVDVLNSETNRDTTIKNRFTEDFETSNMYSGGLKAIYNLGNKSKISLTSHYNIGTQKEYSNFDTDLVLLGASDSIVLNEVTRSRLVGNIQFDHTFSDNHSFFVRTSTNTEKDFRNFLGGYSLNNSIYDFEFQDNISIGKYNNISFGANYRIVNFDIFDINDNSFGITYIDPKATETLNGFFVQNKINTFEGKLNFLVGFKGETYSLINNNYYFSPMMKASYIPNENITIWGGFTQSYTTPGYDNTNVDALLLKTLPDETVNGIATKQVFDGVYNEAIEAGADESAATAAASNFIQSDSGQAIVAGTASVVRSNLPNNAAVTNGESTEPTKFQTFELGFRTNVENTLSLESNFFYSNVSNAIAPGASKFRESKVNSGVFADYFFYGSYVQGTSFGTESMVRFIPSPGTQFEISHVYTESNWEYQENQDFDINDPNEVEPSEIDRTTETPITPKHVLRLKGFFALPRNFNFDFGLIYATKFASENNYDYVKQRHPNIITPDSGTKIATNSERTIVNLRLEKKFLDDKLSVYAFGQDIFNEGKVANTELIRNVTLSQIRAMYGLGVIYKIK